MEQGTFFYNFVIGFLLIGFPCGLISAAIWSSLAKNNEAAILWFLGMLFVGGMLGLLGCIPMTAIAIFLAFKASDETRKAALRNTEKGN